METIIVQRRENIPKQQEGRDKDESDDSDFHFVASHMNDSYTRKQLVEFLKKKWFVLGGKRIYQ